MSTEMILPSIYSGLYFGFRYKVKRGQVTSLDVSTIALSSTAVTFEAPHPYASAPLVFLTISDIQDKSGTTVNSIYTDSVTTTGFTIYYNVTASTATAGSTMTVDYMAVES